MRDLHGHLALITGAAGGIGSAISRALAKAGAAVALVDTSRNTGDALAAELRERGHDAVFFPADITRAPEIAAAVDGAARLGPLTIVVHAAGLLRQGRVEDFAEADWDLVLGVNVKGTFLVTKYAVPHLRRAGGGSIVHLSSVSACVGSDDSAAYHASKGAVLGFSRSTAQELARDGIRVNAACPSWVDAGFTTAALRAMPDPAPLRQRASDAHLLGRMAR